MGRNWGQAWAAQKLLRAAPALSRRPLPGPCSDGQFAAAATPSCVKKCSLANHMLLPRLRGHLCNTCIHPFTVLPPWSQVGGQTCCCPHARALQVMYKGVLEGQSSAGKFLEMLATSEQEAVQVGGGWSVAGGSWVVQPGLCGAVQVGDGWCRPGRGVGGGYGSPVVQVGGGWCSPGLGGARPCGLLVQRSWLHLRRAALHQTVRAASCAAQGNAKVAGRACPGSCAARAQVVVSAGGPCNPGPPPAGRLLPCQGGAPADQDAGQQPAVRQGGSQRAGRATRLLQARAPPSNALMRAPGARLCLRLAGG